MTFLSTAMGGEEKENYGCREVPVRREGSIREIESGYVDS